MTKPIPTSGSSPVAVPGPAPFGPSTPQTPGTAPAKPTCSQCGAPSSGNSIEICRKCGYYARLGTFVEVDPDESDDDTRPQRSHLQVWLGLLPGWVYGVLAVNLLVIAANVAIRLTVADGTPARMFWSVGQVFLALGALATVHIMAYLTAVMQSDNVSMLDIFVRPLACWKPVFRQLPKTLARVAVGSGSVTALLMSLLVVGNLPYSKLWDWGVKPPLKRNLIGAVIAQAKKVNGREMDMEEALDELTKADETADEPPTSEKPRQQVDCVVVGYMLAADGDLDDFRSLVLAGLVKDQLKIVGLVSDGITPELHDELRKRLTQLVTKRPVVSSSGSSSLDAVWVQPVLTCRVSAEEVTPSGRLIGTRFEERLTDIDLSRD